MFRRAIASGRLSGTKSWIVEHLVHDAGVTTARFYDVEGADAAVLFVGGVGGDWDSPARDLYPRLAESLQAAGTRALRVRYRFPTNLDACVRDVQAGIAFLRAQGVTRVGLVGHSLGGAVVVRAAVAAREVTRAVVGLATQAFGAEGARELGPECAILLVHGTGDGILPARCSEHVFDAAREPKRLVLLEGAGHVLDEAADEVEEEVRAWLDRHLVPASSTPE